MSQFRFLLENFFTHKDFLPPFDQIPGTLFTPLQFAVSFSVLLLAVLAASAVSRHPGLVRNSLAAVWAIQVVFEFIMFFWEGTAGREICWNWTTSLPLYPCSIYLFIMPVILWGRGLAKQACCGCLCTLGIVGALVAVFYPAGRLTTYSCISFVGFHTMIYHSAIVFSALVVMLTGVHRYDHVEHWYELFLPCIPSLLASVPANILNYSPLNSDYMYFTGDFPTVYAIFGDAPELLVTAGVYTWYLFIPAIFYLPSYLHGKWKACHAVSQ